MPTKTIIKTPRWATPLATHSKKPNLFNHIPEQTHNRESTTSIIIFNNIFLACPLNTSGSQDYVEKLIHILVFQAGISIFRGIGGLLISKMWWNVYWWTTGCFFWFRFFQGCWSQDDIGLSGKVTPGWWNVFLGGVCVVCC